MSYPAKRVMSQMFTEFAHVQNWVLRQEFCKATENNDVDDMH